MININNLLNNLSSCDDTFSQVNVIIYLPDCASNYHLLLPPHQLSSYKEEKLMVLIYGTISQMVLARRSYSVCNWLKSVGQLDPGKDVVLLMQICQSVAYTLWSFIPSEIKLLLTVLVSFTKFLQSSKNLVLVQAWVPRCGIQHIS